MTAMITRTRVISTVYTYLPDRYCTHCGIKGIYEDDCDDFYTGCNEYCIECDEGKVIDRLHDPTALAKIKNRDATIVDAVTCTEEISPLSLELEKNMAELSRLLNKALYGKEDDK